MAIVNIIDNCEGASWRTLQTDSTSVNSTFQGWRTIQTDSVQASSAQMSWRTIQTDSVQASSAQMSWRTIQTDIVQAGIEFMNWRVIQQDTIIPLSEEMHWREIQNDSIETPSNVMRWRVIQSDDILVDGVPPTLFIWSNPQTTIDVNETYSYVWRVTSDYEPISAEIYGNANFLYSGNVRIYGTPLVAGNYTVSILFSDARESLWQNYTLTVIGDTPIVPEPPEDDSFKIQVNDLLIWGVVLFIPIGIVFLFGMLTRNSRR